jgi:hypothetical protein
MRFERGDIVEVVKHTLAEVVGRSAEVRGGPYSPEPTNQLLAFCLKGIGIHEEWYMVFDQAGEWHPAARSWLRRVPGVWVPGSRHAEYTV